LPPAEPVNAGISSAEVQVAVLDYMEELHHQYLQALEPVADIVCIQFVEDFLEFVHDHPNVKTLVLQARCRWTQAQEYPTRGVCRGLLTLLRQNGYKGQIIIVTSHPDDLGCKNVWPSEVDLLIPKTDFWKKAGELIKLSAA
jgi:hypothetical protein